MTLKSNDSPLLRSDAEALVTATYRAKLWARRARLDYQALRRTSPVAKRKGTLPPDPALAVQLLQQCVEKSLKALLVACGEDEKTFHHYPYGHANLSLFMGFMKRITDTTLSQEALKVIFSSAGAGHMSFPKMLELTEELRTSSGRLKDDPDFWGEWASCPPEIIQTLCDKLLWMREVFTSTVKQSMKSDRLSVDFYQLLMRPHPDEVRKIAAAVTSQVLILP